MQRFESKGASWILALLCEPDLGLGKLRVLGTKTH